MKAQNAKGTRDFSPEEKIVRNELINRLTTIFERYGYSPIETPIIMRYDVLSAKFAAGEESDALKETFKIKDKGERDLGLRFDLTVPLAKYIALNPQVKLPFKRYEIGRVYRDGPIKLGRYREFLQCDVDIVGSKLMITEAELLKLTQDFFDGIKLDIVIKVNNRKLLNELLEVSGIKNRKDDALICLDKLDKFGVNEVSKEMKEKGFNDSQIKLLLGLIKEKDIKKLKDKVKNYEGINELEKLFDYLKNLKVNFEFEPSLARGLSYYTGTIFEVYSKKGLISSSLAGGGRYDDMIKGYIGSNQDYPAVGISFGLEPIIESIKLNKKDFKKTVTQIYVIPIKITSEAMKITMELRKQFNVEIDLMNRSISKNMEYADTLGIPYVVFVGEKELKENKVKLKDMKSGKEEMVSIKDISKKIKS